ncbi:hypothetical protein GSI_10315 [Ganoderma sinense ZZ0214-1]|uniref:Integrase catalytic domain-containing protein n=1 Tax=Ganoderma sinense ZZ0214-1 TaxID=1077348 RepID=A0A2G8S068_9APHY|nr:hypothetical protein GSI_10315 [Ganoderma sinense ZZ0214-1]
MGKVDALSRRVDYETGPVVKDVTLLKAHWFAASHTVDGADNLKDMCLKHVKLYDRSVVEKLGKDNDWELAEDGLIYRRGKMVIPNHPELRGRVIASHHDSIAAGHPGAAKTQDLIMRSYWWPTIRKDVIKYVTGCITCQCVKIDRQPRAAPLNPNPIPDQNWQFVTMDYMTGLPECNGHDAILVFVDMKSKDYIAIPCSKTLDSEGQARLFIKHVVVPHSLPKRIWSDRGPTLVSSFTKEVYRQMGIEGNPSTAYHPQTDGQTERMNQEIQTYLRIFINYKQDDWVEWLPLAEFAYRCRVHASTGMSPFFMTHGHEPNTGVETLKDGINESAK